MGRWGQGLDWLRGLCNHLVGWTLTLAQVRSLNVLVIDKDVDLERLHVDERLWAVIATQNHIKNGTFPECKMAQNIKQGRIFIAPLKYLRLK